MFSGSSLPVKPWKIQGDPLVNQTSLKEKNVFCNCRHTKEISQEYPRNARTTYIYTPSHINQEIHGDGAQGNPEHSTFAVSSLWPTDCVSKSEEKVSLRGMCVYV